MAIHGHGDDQIVYLRDRISHCRQILQADHLNTFKELIIEQKLQCQQHLEKLLEIEGEMIIGANQNLSHLLNIR